MRSRIGVLGGTFNPVHIGHLILAQDALEKFGLDQVLFVPCANPPHKRPRRLAPAKHRLAMLKAALKGDSRFAVSTVEIDRGGVSYSIDTIRQLRRAKPKARFYFIIGADTLPELRTWRSIRKISGLCTFVAMGRPGYAGRATRGFRARPFPGHLIDISSSEIRQRVSEGKSIRHLVPAAVERYISHHGLYAK